MTVEKIIKNQTDIKKQSASQVQKFGRFLGFFPLWICLKEDGFSLYVHI